MSRARKRTLEGIPVVDAKEALRVFVNKDDIATAIRKDPAHCAFSNACRRLYGSHAVVFFRTVGYVELPDGKNSTRLERFSLPRSMRKLIVALDRTGKASPNGYLMLPPSPGFTMDHRLKISKEYAERRAELDRNRPKRKKEPIDPRSGKGIVQFIKHEKHSLRALMTPAE